MAIKCNEVFLGKHLHQCEGKVKLSLRFLFVTAPHHAGVLGNGGIMPHILNQLHAPATLPPGKEPLVPIG